MFIVESYSVAILFCFVTMICWGSWANTQKLAQATWRFELFYWDYVLGIMIMSLAFAFTLGSFGDQGRSFGDDLSQAGSSSLTTTFLGGVIFNLANILLIAAIAIAGMSVAFPVGIGIALILGVVDNYRLSPSGNPVIIFTGVALVAAGIVLNAVAYRQLSAATKQVSGKGLLLSIIAGVLMSQFYGFVVKGMAGDFSDPQPGKLTPYTSVVIFSGGILLSNFVFNTILMRKPLQGKPISYSEYFAGSFRNHVTGILGGMIWCIGMLFSIIASGPAGPAISYGLGQGAVLVAAIWGVFIWREFARAPKGTIRLVYLMFLCFIAGLGFLIYART